MHRSGFCEKVPEASLKSSRANARQLQDGFAVAVAEPVNNGGSPSGITYLRREIKQLHNSTWRD